MSASEKHCIPCKQGTPAIAAEKAQTLVKDLAGWRIAEDGKWLLKHYKFKNFAAAISFVNKVGEIAEAEQHHPDIRLGWGYAEIHLQTHAAGGLHENDFILAEKIENIQ